MCKAMENLKEAMAGDLHLNARRSIKGKFGTDGVAFSQAVFKKSHFFKHNSRAWDGTGFSECGFK